MSNKDSYNLQIDDVERRLIVVALTDLMLILFQYLPD